MSYWLAPSLVTLRAECNALAPNRDRTSDGWIGDKAHAATESQHNPSNWPPSWSGVVRAYDFDHDPAGGLDCNVLAAWLVALLGRHPALGSGAYIIFNGRIISTDRLGEGWRRYTGKNAHKGHLHLSVGTSPAAYNSTHPWGVMEGTNMAEASSLGQQAKVDLLTASWIIKNPDGTERAVPLGMAGPLVIWYGDLIVSMLREQAAKVDALSKANGIDSADLARLVEEAAETGTGDALAWLKDFTAKGTFEVSADG